VWPRRKLLLIAASGTPGIDGVQSLLNELNLECSVFDPTNCDLSSETQREWLERPLGNGCEEVCPFTEGIVWPNVEHEIWFDRILEQGLSLKSIESFLHSILEDELVLCIPDETVLLEGYPIIGHILKEAGFEPSILWQTNAETWKCERRLGLIWILPESWVGSLAEEHKLGRAKNLNSKVSWELHETGVDFYREESEKEQRIYVGQLPRWPNSKDELSAVSSIAKCLDLGVSWFDIKIALRSIWTDGTTTDNLRWNSNGFGWNAGACGEKLSFEAVNHMEDWWAR
jgi:hypothetical protein